MGMFTFRVANLIPATPIGKIEMQNLTGMSSLFYSKCQFGPKRAAKGGERWYRSESTAEKLRNGMSRFPATSSTAGA